MSPHNLAKMPRLLRVFMEQIYNHSHHPRSRSRNSRVIIPGYRFPVHRDFAPLLCRQFAALVGQGAGEELEDEDLEQGGCDSSVEGDVDELEEALVREVLPVGVEVGEESGNVDERVAAGFVWLVIPTWSRGFR